jgi:hypothetical protein
MILGMLLFFVNESHNAHQGEFRTLIIGPGLMLKKYSI